MACHKGGKKPKKMASGGSVAQRVSKLENHERGEAKIYEQEAKDHRNMKSGGSVQGQPGNSNGIRQRKNLAMGK